MTASIEYDSQQKRLIHRLIDTAFNDEELINFCAEDFQAVFNRFRGDTDKATKIQMLVEASAQQGQLGELVAAIKKAKPDVYETFARQMRTTQPTHPAKKPPSSPPPAKDAPLSSIKRTTRLIMNPERFLDRSLEGRYRITQILDRSGLGAVFKGYDTKLQLDVAIKIIDLALVKQPTMVERVRQEVQTAKKLDHPCVVRVYDFGQADSLLYIIMEFISGFNLKEARQQFKGLTYSRMLPQFLKLARQICLTVDYLHQQNVLHPGTKPENIMLKPGSTDEDMSWRPVLINMGLLRPNREVLLSGQEISPNRLTYTVSPELLLGHSTDTRSDVYTLGVILYDLLAGRPPFMPQNLDEARQLHIDAKPPDPRSINADLPEAVQKILLKALAKDPSERYISAKEMAQAFAACLEQPTLPPLPDQVSITLPDSHLTVRPGERLLTPVLLHNKGQQNAPCQIRVQGVPAEWVSIMPSSITLPPDEQQEIELTLQPPLSPHSRAKHYALALQVVGRDRRQIDEVKAVLKMERYAAFDSSLWPQEISPEQVTQVTIENQGNTTETFTIRPQPEPGLRIQPDQHNLKIGPGDSDKVGFRVTPRFRLLGEAVMQTFSFEVSLPGGEKAIHSGEVTSRGLMSTRIALAVLLTLSMMACVIFSFYSVVTNTLPANATVQAIEGEQAALVAVTRQSARAEATTARAATETAVWLTQDSDGDDLLNRDELQQGTDPDNPDSDGDGLPDGIEVSEFGTHPRFADSDFDGVPDGEEVRQMSDAGSRDSDGDGTPDSLDADLRQIPTATRTPNPTVTPETVQIRFSQSPTIFGELPQYQVRENQVAADIDVVLSAASNRLITVDYALQGEKYRRVWGTLRFPPGTTHQSFEVRLINDGISRLDNEVVMMTLDNASTGAEIETRIAELVILDDD